MTPRPGCRKIVLATNICETSVTIADCVCGFKSECKAKDRSCSRVQPGICCKLYWLRAANTVMKKQSTPELQRVLMEEVCLSILAGRRSENCMNFLLQAPQPPSIESVDNALRVLKEV
eukprot:scaffold2504_cov248-Chaetoceros_neogracile.AAC.5